jgi:hypothetical protein
LGYERSLSDSDLEEKERDLCVRAFTSGGFSEGNMGAQGKIAIENCRKKLFRGTLCQKATLKIPRP